jgi:hypothetical protein
MFVLLSFVWVNGKTGFDWCRTYEPWNDMSSNIDHKYLSAFNRIKMDKGSPLKAGLPYMPSELHPSRFPEPASKAEQVSGSDRHQDAVTLVV